MCEYNIDNKNVREIHFDMTPEEYEKEKYYQIAERNRVICKPLNWNISYEGDITISCQMKGKERHAYHISEGIKPLKTFCQGGDCYCSFYGYKEIHGEKK